MVDFKNINYLLNGSVEQQRIYHLLIETGILNKLAIYEPIVVGSYPLDIQTASSDVDIICQFQDIILFESELIKLFGKEANFSIRRPERFGTLTIVAEFEFHDQPFEIFAQQTPTQQQMGYLHLRTEYRILLTNNESFKQEIIALKETGIKTEPAFCEALGLSGDPYHELLNYKI